MDPKDVIAAKIDKDDRIPAADKVKAKGLVNAIIDGERKRTQPIIDSLVAALTEVLGDTEAWRIGLDTRTRALAAIAKATVN